MTVPEFRAYVKNIYTSCTAAQTAADIPAGEAVFLARVIIAAQLTRESIDIPKV